MGPLDPYHNPLLITVTVLSLRDFKFKDNNDLISFWLKEKRDFL